MSARKIEQDPPHIAAARARLMDEVCAALPPEAVYRQSPPMTDTPGTLEERLRRNSGWRNERHQCVTDPNLLTEAADEIASLRARVEAMTVAGKLVFEAWDAHVTANDRTNAAIPAIDATRAERAVYDERYRVSEEAKREWYRAMHRFIETPGLRAALSQSTAERKTDG